MLSPPGSDRGTVWAVSPLTVLAAPPDAPLGRMPTYIPVEVCTAVGRPMVEPADKCLTAVKADVAKDGVAAPPADVPGLLKIVANAKQRGIDLKVVVMEKSPLIDTPLRDIATNVGHDNPGSTVLVLSPGWAGSYSPTYTRVLLEAGQDVAKTAPNSVQGAQNFVDQLDTPIFNWTAFTVVVVLAVGAAAVGTRLLQRWAGRPVKTGAKPDTAGKAAAN